MSISHESFDLLKVDRDIDRRARAVRVASVALWGGLLAFGLRRRGGLGLAAMAVSLERLYHLFAPASRNGSRAVPGRAPRRAMPTGKQDWDQVDQALWETFPASDPPGR
jgi:hypothetical protein